MSQSKKALFAKTACAAAVAMASFGANALTVSPATPTSYGSPLFGDTAITAFTVPTVGATTNVTSTNIVVNDQGVVEVYLQLPAGAKWNNAALNGNAGTTSLSNMTVAGKSVALNTAALGAGDISSSGRTIRLRYTVAAGQTSLIGFGANFAAPNVANQILTAGSGLGVAGSTLGVTVAVYANAGTATTVTDTLPTSGSPATLQQIENTVTANVAQSVVPFSCTSALTTGTAAASSAALIDAIQAVGANAPNVDLQNPDATAAANTAGVDFGRIACTASATAKEADGVTAYSAAAHTISATFTGTFPATGLTPATVVGSVYGAAPAACGAEVAIPAGMTAGTFTTAAAAFAVANQLRLCVGYHVAAAGLTAGTISETTPTWTATVLRATGTCPATTAACTAGTGSGTLYALRPNGAQVEMMYAVPGSAAESFLRIINTGTISIAANRVTGQYIYADGMTSATCTLNTAAVPAGGSLSILQSATSNLQGAPFNCALDTTKPFPRLRITAPTNDMTVQYFVKNLDWVLYGNQQAQRQDVSAGAAQGADINRVRSFSK